MHHHSSGAPARGLLVYVAGTCAEESTLICSVLRNLTGVYAARTFADNAAMLRRAAVSPPDACVISSGDVEQNIAFTEALQQTAPASHTVIAGGTKAAYAGAVDMLPVFTPTGIAHTKFVVASEHIFSGIAAQKKAACVVEEKPKASRTLPPPSSAPVAKRAEASSSAAGAKIKGNTVSSVTFTLPVHAVAIGSSTGGPDVLNRILECLKNMHLRCPVFVTQHMPEKFTAMLAERLARAGGIPCKEGEDGEVAMPGLIYIAPGNYHMRVGMEDGKAVIRLAQDDKVNFCRPAVDPMMQSIAACYGSRVLGAVLTGMGNDGAGGAQAIRARGGKVVIQDEAGSAVWGMPGAVHACGAFDDIVTPEGVAHAIAAANHTSLS